MTTPKRIAAATLIVATLLLARPADAAPSPANADGVASASLGSIRAVAWVVAGTEDARLYLQWLSDDGTPKGGPRLVGSGDEGQSGDFTRFGRDVSLSLSPNGAVVSVSGILQPSFGGDPPYYTSLQWWVPNRGPVEWLGGPCAWSEGLVDDPRPRVGSVAWNGHAFLIAGECAPGLPGEDGYISVTAWDPDTSIYSGGGFYRAESVGPPVVGTRGSDFGVVWHEFTGEDTGLDVKGVLFNQDGGQVGQVRSVAQGEGDQMQPAVAGNNVGFLVTWINATTNGSRTIRGRVLTGVTAGPEKTLVSAPGNRNHPWVARSTAGGWHLAWADLRSGNNDVYSAHVSTTGVSVPLTVSPTGGALLAGGAGAQQAPTVSPLPNGRAYVAFLDRGVAKVRDLTASSAPTGTAKVVSVSPK